MIRFMVVVTFISLFSFRASSADVFHKEVDVHADSLFIPMGFDDNDEVVVVVDGYLPDPCHQLIRPYVKVDELSRRITISPRAREFLGVCHDVIVPYTQEVHIGQLPRGQFTVNTKDGLLRERLLVGRSVNPGPDDYLYAPVDNARVIFPSSPTGERRWVAVLEGRYTNSCLVIAETQVSLTGKTIQVLPIMKLQTEEESGTVCRQQEQPFKLEIELPTLTEEGRYLLHVRSLNGQSVNRVFYRTP